MEQYVKLGIDLGTTNSCIACWEGSALRVFANNDLMNVTPSVVRILKTGRIIVGKKAYNAAADDSDNVAAEFKRLMGERDKHVFPASGRSLSPEELSAEVLKSLREDVRRQSGEDVEAAVITIPAAFDGLQCEATARAAKMAGFYEAPLLMEPIAAAIAYGVSPNTKNERWLVFDLGGGTLDVAIISTSDGRLTVLEQRGDNLLGGKDIDRQIVESIFLPALIEAFALPENSTPEFKRLFRLLRLKAEEAKIELSTSEQVLVSLFDLGEDSTGNQIEAELTVHRRDVEKLMEGIIEKCLRLIREAISAARINASDLNRIVLVGGPTQMPVMRSVLRESTGVQVDHSLDPMTVVARGAALFASTLARTRRPTQSAMPPNGKVTIALHVEGTCSDLDCPVAGRVGEPWKDTISEIKIDAEAGYWTSGWIPIVDGFFEVAVRLQESRLTRFWIYVRDRQGSLMDVEPAEFSVRHGLVPSEPPLPHTISVEIIRADGRHELEPVFYKNSLLPTEKTQTFKANHTLRPSEPGTSIAIKLWEGEQFSDPDANTFIGNMHIHADGLQRPVPEGAEIQLFVKIDASRLIVVEAFIPHLNQHFSEGIYMPLDERRDDISERAKSVPAEVNQHLKRLDDLEDELPGNEAVSGEISQLRRELEDLDLETSASAAPVDDPDRAARAVQASRELRKRISGLEKSVGRDTGKRAREADVSAAIARAKQIVDKHGSTFEKKELDLLSRDIEKAMGKDDERVVKKLLEQINSLQTKVLFAQDWFWREIFQYLREPGQKYLNDTEAQKWIGRGDEAVKQANGELLKEVVRQLWKLQPPNAREQDEERAVQSGLRKY